MVQTLEGPLPPGATTGRPSEVGDPEPVAEKGRGHWTSRHTTSPGSHGWRHVTRRIPEELLKYVSTQALPRPINSAPGDWPDWGEHRKAPKGLGV